jgi:hypothetical protein
MFPWCFFGLSLRLNAKSGIVAGLDAAAWVAFKMIHK